MNRRIQGTSVEDYDGENFRFPARRAKLSAGTVLPFGTLIWSAGLQPVQFISGLDLIGPDLIGPDWIWLDLPKGKNGRVIVDEFLLVKGFEGSIGVMWMIVDSLTRVEIRTIFVPRWIWIRVGEERASERASEARRGRRKDRRRTIAILFDKPKTEHPGTQHTTQN